MKRVLLIVAIVANPILAQDFYPVALSNEKMDQSIDNLLLSMKQVICRFGLDKLTLPDIDLGLGLVGVHAHEGEFINSTSFRRIGPSEVSYNNDTNVTTVDTVLSFDQMRFNYKSFSLSILFLQFSGSMDINSRGNVMGFNITFHKEESGKCWTTMDNPELSLTDITASLGPPGIYNWAVSKVLSNFVSYFTPSFSAYINSQLSPILMSALMQMDLCSLITDE